MENQVMEIAERIRGLRLILELTEEEMAKITDLTVEEYIKAEHGETDFLLLSFTSALKLLALILPNC